MAVALGAGDVRLAMRTPPRSVLGLLPHSVAVANWTRSLAGASGPVGAQRLTRTGASVRRERTGKPRGRTARSPPNGPKLRLATKPKSLVAWPNRDDLQDLQARRLLPADHWSSPGFRGRCSLDEATARRRYPAPSRPLAIPKPAGPASRPSPADRSWRPSPRDRCWSPADSRVISPRFGGHWRETWSASSAKAG